MVEEIFNRTSGYSYTLRIQIFRLLIVETVFLAVNKGSFERASLRYFQFVWLAVIFVLVRSFLCIRLMFVSRKLKAIWNSMAELS